MLYSGKYLRINLTNKDIQSAAISEADTRKYLLGSGFAAYCFMKEMDPRVDALDENSVIYIFNGLLSGSSIPTACRTSFCGRSPLTGIWNESNVGGHFGAELRKAGLDGLVIAGKAKKPVYLFIHDGQVEFRQADHLWGKDTFDTYDQIILETHPKARAAVIGPAGERLVRFAGIMQGGRNQNRAAGRGGMGAVFGSKHLKGIAVVGSEKGEAEDPGGLRDLIREQIPIIKNNAVGLSKYGTAGGVAGSELFGDLPIRNYQGGNWEEGAMVISGQNLAEQYPVKQTFCHACPIGCGKHVDAQMADGTHIQGEAPEYETLAGMGAMLEIGDLDAMIKVNDLCNRAGLDTISASTIAAFATEAFENGLISAADCLGQSLKWKDPQSLYHILDLICNRQGIGDLLAQGVREASRQLGGGSEAYAIQVKGLEMAYHDPRATFSMAANYATANRGACHLEGLSYWRIYGLDGTSWSKDKPGRFSNEGAAREAITFQNYFSTFNPLGLCKFLGKAGVSPDVIAAFLTRGLGWEVTGEQLLETGERIFNLKRMINNRYGISRDDDSLPERLTTLARPSGGAAGKVPDMAYILADYYALRGWNAEGEVTEETRQRLGLEL